MQSFSEIFTFEDYMRLENAHGQDWRDLKATTFQTPLLHRLLTLRAEGALSPIRGAAGRSGSFLKTWNEFLTAAEDTTWTLRDVSGMLGDAFLAAQRGFVLLKHQNGGDENVAHEMIWREIVRRIDAGDIPLGFEARDFMGGDWYFDCGTTGETLSLGMKNWVPTLYEFTPGKSPVEVSDLEPVSVKHLTLEIERGELLVADAFTVGKFWDRLGKLDKDPNGASSVAGRELMTKTYLEALSMVHVSVGNTSPSVFLRDGVVAIGTVDTNGDDWEEAEEFEDTALGRTCTDLWWVSMIERHRLVDFVAEDTGSREEAERLVTEHIEQNKSDLTIVDIEPGTYHLYFTGDIGNENRDRIFTDDVDFGRLETMFVLSPRELDLLPERRLSEEVAAPAMR